MMVARRTRGPAYANLQGRKPREVGSGGALEAMGIWSLVLCCRSALSACLGSDRGGNEPGQPIATGRIGVAHRRSSDKTAVHDRTAASMLLAVWEPAKSKGRTGLSPQIDAGHDVSILTMAADVLGR